MLPDNYLTLHGWCTLEKANKLIELVLTTKPNLVVELGVFGGRSLLPLALASVKTNPAAKIIGIDAWTAEASLEGKNSKENDSWWEKINYNEMQQYTQQLMNKHNLGKNVELWKTKSIDAVDKFMDNSIDILHQDSNHSEKISISEVEHYLPKLKSGGYWVFDDTNWGTTKQAQSLLESRGCVEIFVAANNEWKIYKKL